MLGSTPCPNCATQFWSSRSPVGSAQGLAGSGCVAFPAGTARRGALVRSSTSPTSWTCNRRARPCTWSSMACRADLAWLRDHTSARVASAVTSCCAPAPNRRCAGEVLGELVDVSLQLGVAEAFAVGGIPAMASHRRPVSVLATGTDEALVDGRAWRQDYTGPTGAQSVLQVMLGDAGVPTLALWAQVPHYLSGGASPPAIRAVLERLRDLAGLSVDLDGLDDQSVAYVDRIEAGLTDRPDVVEIIAAIEEGEDDVDETELPSGDELASEIERFLLTRAEHRPRGAGRCPSSRSMPITVPKRARRRVRWRAIAARAGEVSKSPRLRGLRAAPAHRRPRHLPRVHAV